MRTKEFTLVSQGVASNTAFAASQALTASTALTLQTAAASISPARELTLTSASDLSAITFTIVGLDRRGQTITEDVLGPNATTVRAKKVYSKITSITPSATSANQVSVGYPARVCSPWYAMDSTRSRDAVPTALVEAIAVAGQTFGAASVERTMQNVMRISGEGADPAGSAGSLAAAGDTVSVQGAAFRVVLTATSGQTKFAASLPGF